MRSIFVLLNPFIFFLHFINEILQECKRKFIEEFPRLWVFFLVSGNTQLVGAFCQIGFFIFLLWTNFRRRRMMMRNENYESIDSDIVQGGGPFRPVIDRVSQYLRLKKPENE